MKNNKGFTLLEVMVSMVLTFVIIVFIAIGIGFFGLLHELKSDMNHDNQNQVEIREPIVPEDNKQL